MSKRFNWPAGVVALALAGTLALATVAATADAPAASNGAAAAAAPPASTAAAPAADASAAASAPATESKQEGGEPDGVVQVANLIYAGAKSSTCFSDHFLIQAEKESSISTSRRFHAVKLASQELFDFPLVIMTGEGVFELPDVERQNLRRFVEGGGLLLASASCSSPDWDRSFRAEMAKVFPEYPLSALPMTHPVFHTVYDVGEMHGIHGQSVHALEGVSINNRLGVIYSQDGLNDTAHTQGCCCCGGNEIVNDAQINVNILAYALLY